MSNIWTAVVSLDQHKLDRAQFTKPITRLPLGSPVLYTLSLPEQASSLAFLQEFIRILRENWKSQDTPLVAYNGSTTASTTLYTRQYYRVKNCTRFSTFVEYEVDSSPSDTTNVDPTNTNVDPTKLSNVFLNALSNSLFDASGAGPTEAGLQFWAQFASSNPVDKVNLVIEGIYVKTTTAMVPKGSLNTDPDDDTTTDPANPVRHYNGKFGIEIIRI